ncbi:MAG: RsmE family RNA methyltransferase [Myxococcota bacterium]
MRRFLTPRLPTSDAPATLSAAVSHHLLRVAGIAPDEIVELFDGQGGVCQAILQDVAEGRATLRFVAPVQPPQRPARWLLAGLLTGPAFDQVVRMSTELGVDHLCPVLLSRSIARGDRMKRWVRISESAAAQSGRAIFPTLYPPAPLTRALDRLPHNIDGRVFVPGASAAAPAPGPAAALLGPEGGLTNPEIEEALDAGFQMAGLGPLVLRADTAAVAALARLIP